MVAILLIAASPAVASSHTGYGSHVAGGEDDEGLALSSFGDSRALCFVDQAGSGSHASGDPVYASDACDSVSAGDLRLTVGQPSDPGTQVEPGDADEGNPLTGLGSAVVGYIDEDETRDYSGDPVYIDVHATRQLDPGDVRLTDTTSGDAGTFVGAGDSDAGATVAQDSDLSASNWAFHDTDGSQAWSLDDTMYIDADGDGAVSVEDVRLGEMPNEPPSASFTVVPSSPQAGEQVAFDASGSSDPDGSIAGFSWDFDDGETGAGETIDHAFEEPGVHQVTLAVTDDDGATDTSSRSVPVGPRADCQASPTTVAPGETVELDANASKADEVEFSRDGATGYDHVETSEPYRWETSYAQPGTYKPHARASHGSVEGTHTDACGTVTVQEGPTARFSYTPSEPVVDQTVALDASDSSSSGSIEEFRWDVDDDGTVDATRSTPILEHNFGEADVHDVRLTIVDEHGNEDETVEMVPVRPRASCQASPERVDPGDPVVLDASNSTADDARFSRHGDEDFDIQADEDLTATVTYENPGTYEPHAQAREGELRTEAPCGRIVVGGFEADCVAWPRVAEVRDTVRLDTNRSDAIIVDFSEAGDEAFEHRVDAPPFVQEVTYDRPGTYEPHARVLDPQRGSQTVVSCGEVEIHGADVVCTAKPARVEPNETVTLDASSSRGDRGAFAKDEGEPFEPGDDAFVRDVTYEENGTYTPQARVWLGGSYETAPCNEVTVGEDDGVPPWAWLIPGGLGGLVACRFLRGLPAWLGGPPPGILSYATGTFELSTGEASVRVDVGFEPDLVLLTASTNVKPGDPHPDRSDGWCFGTAKRNEDGSFTQYAVAASDDNESEEGALGVARDDAALHVVFHGDGGVGALEGRVEEATDDGFHVTVDAETLPADRGDEAITVLFKAFETTSLDHVAAGHLSAPTDAGATTVPVGVEADYLYVTSANEVADFGNPHEVVDPRNLDDVVDASQAHRALDLERLATTESPDEAHRLVDASQLPSVVDLDVPEEGLRLPNLSLTDGLQEHPIGLVVGEATGPQPLRQHGQNSVVDPSSVLRTSYAAFDDAILPLLEPQADGSPGGRLGRVTHIGEETRLAFETLGGEATPDRESLVAYAALDTGTQRQPVTGTIELPGPDEAPVREVDVGFRPSMIEFVACNADREGEAYTMDTRALSFGWSIGTAMPNAEGGIDHHLLHASRTGETFGHEPDGEAEAREDSAGPTPDPVPTPQTTGAPGRFQQDLAERLGSLAAIGRGDRAATPPGGLDAPDDVREGIGARVKDGDEDEGHDGEPGGGRHGSPVEDLDPVACAYVVDEDGQIVGRQDVTVTRVTEAGFEIAVHDVVRAGPEHQDASHAIVHFTAWPQPGSGRRFLPS